VKNYHLYIITNLVNQKKYVGITKVGYEKRFEKHLLNAEKLIRRHQQIVLYLSIRKYGADKFSIEFLQEGNDWQHLKELEIATIIKHNTFIDDGCGYNMTRGGDGTDGYKWSQEQLDRRPKTLSEERKDMVRGDKNPKYWLGKNHSTETIDKIRMARANQIISKGTRQKHRDNWMGSKNPNAKAVLIGEQYFSTVKEAAKFAGIHTESIRRRIRNSNFPD